MSHIRVGRVASRQRRLARHRVHIAAALLVGCFVLRAEARTWHINAGATGDAPTIQAGIDSSANGDQLLLAPGTYAGEGNRDVDFLGKAVTVTSSGGAASTVVDCQAVGRGFLFRSGEAGGSILSGITIRNGYSVEDPGSPDDHRYDYGGAVLCLTSSPLIEDVVFQGNSAMVGGAAVYCDRASPTIRRCIFRDNTCAFGGTGGGICCIGESAPIISDNTFLNNTAQYGGAVYCANGASPVLSDNTLSGNGAVSGGGGINCVRCAPEIRENRIEDGSADYGGGIQCYQSDATIVGNILRGNQSYWGGAALHFVESSPVIRHNTVSESAVAHEGAAIWVANVPPAYFWMESTIVAFTSNGAGVNCAGVAWPAFVCCCFYGNEDGDWICGDDMGGTFVADPAFCGIVGSGNYFLRSNSPCAPDNHPGGEPCGLIGALAVACGAVEVETLSWGAIKALYR